MTEGSQPINVVANMHGYCSNLSIVSENEACGLTKREYFAARALQGILSHGWNSNLDNQHDRIALKAVMIADEIIKALNK